MDWLFTDWNILWHAMLSVIIMLLVIVLITRINGLRSFAKITPIDFAVTITIGSVISGTVLTNDNSIVKGVFVIALLIAMQTLFGWLKAKYKWFDKTVFNQPLFLMYEGEFLEKNIDSSKISRENVIAKLRENNVSQLKEVRAVILETTGDISVIKGDKKIDSCLLSDVRFKPEEIVKRDSK